MARCLMRFAGVVLVAAALSAAPAPVAADEGQAAAPPTWWAQAGRKLGRGLANILTGPCELLRTPYLVGQKDGGVAAITVGLVKGLGALLVREIAGVVEVVTWPVPIPEEDFAPLVTPEFVYAHGDWTREEE